VFPAATVAFKTYHFLKFTKQVKLSADGSTVAEYSTIDCEVKGLNPTIQEENGWKKMLTKCRNK
jgi:hypothetical protein